MSPVRFPLQALFFCIVFLFFFLFFFFFIKLNIYSMQHIIILYYIILLFFYLSLSFNSLFSLLYLCTSPCTHRILLTTNRQAYYNLVFMYFYFRALMLYTQPPVHGEFVYYVSIENDTLQIQRIIYNHLCNIQYLLSLTNFHHILYVP